MTTRLPLSGMLPRPDPSLIAQPPSSSDISPGTAREHGCLLTRYVETPIGTMLALANAQGLYLLDFLDRRGLPRKLQSLGERLHVVMVPGTNAHLDVLDEQLSRYFSGSSLTFDLPCIFTGSPWEQQVWRHLLTIPPGVTNSYSQMAAALGRPTASRSVGRANGMNFLALLIPCHRVIAADGSLCGYGGGLWRKQWLLEHEFRHAPSPKPQSP